ncbi:MAG TPA: NADH-quinone oxidoreductase subunit NuoH [Methanosarcinales archaeon]|nr:NADH-quinone oxidoreductase subunit NuoH [Methanosarcinales archaeon]
MIIGLFDMFKGNMVNIPLIQPLIDALLGLPIVNYLIALILWKPLFAILLLPGFGGMMTALLLIIWFERKLTARIQWRIGPLEVSRPIWGIIQPMADGIRYFFQEVIVHKDAHKLYFIQLPILAFFPALIPLLVIPGSETIYGIRTIYAIPIILAVIALIPMTIVAMGWAANSRFAYIGSVREAFMYFAYEIPFIIAVLAMVMMYGSADPMVIVESQTIPYIGMVLNPFALITFLLVIAMATSRLPFEIPEADQEIAFGPFVEYSGILFGLVMTLAYEKMYIMCLLFTTLFLGGWNGPQIPMLGDLSGPIWLYVKTVVLMMMIVFLRSVYPRFRLDQAIKIGWNRVMSLSIVSFAFALVVVKLAGWL